MDFLSGNGKEATSPDMPEDVVEGKADPRKTVDYLPDSRMRYEKYEDGEKIVAKIETEALRGLIGYSIDDVSSLLDSIYPTRLSETEFDDMEYGNGWAIFYRRKQ